MADTRFVVITGTGTGVGKTWVSCALAKELARTMRVVAIKPVETGVTDGAGDGELLAAATGQKEPRHALLRLREPLTPALAAEREGVVIDFEALVAGVRRVSVDCDLAIVEGAGGLLSPITYDADAMTLASALGARVVLVAADALGTISAVHTAVKCLAPMVVALVEPAVRDASTGTNANVLRRRIGGAAPIVELARNGSVDALAAVITSRA